ncbi:hypothetical protein ERO13_D07G160300v2 [Gossypium hirsutum]|uniref:Uncharacterized protein n=1 Tax=Gossypium tomentosum TaxID=34277 RepID=A0A5D2K822_GOSTO|nr:hypothetical protein ERO13_D07G160300v2 [Gossypium hirsutum]TYH63308.1 hypothetical protein ES332_D07G182700v1 [Gossypium tomentosum]
MFIGLFICFIYFFVCEGRAEFEFYRKNIIVLFMFKSTYAFFLSFKNKLNKSQALNHPPKIKRVYAS